MIGVDWFSLRKHVDSPISRGSATRFPVRTSSHLFVKLHCIC